MKQGGNFRVLTLILAFFGLLALSAGIVYGQTVSGNLIGTVLDSQGAAVVGADVTATNVATNVVASTKTSGIGEYRFDNLLAGTYRITVKMTGFKATSEMVSVELNKTGTRNVTLTPGAATETVEVSGVPPVLDTTSAQIQTTFSPKELADLPSVSGGNGIINLSLLDAGVASNGGVGVGTGPSISGQRPRNNNYTVEGVDNNSKSVTGPLVALPNDSVDQFTVLQNQFAPEFGHSSGGQFNQTIKSGSNSFHGKVYEYFQNKDLNAIDSQVALSEVSSGQKPYNPRFDQNRFGGQIGGPIIKNKLFFFTDWEYQPYGAVGGASTGCVPTAAGYTALASMPQANITPVPSYWTPPEGQPPYLPVAVPVNTTNVAQLQAGAGTAAAQAPAGDANCPQWAAGFWTFPNPNGDPTTGDPLHPDSTQLVQIGDIGYKGASYNNTLNGITSIDWNISSKDQLRGRYAYQKFSAIDSSPQISSFFTTYPAKNHLFTLSEFHTFTTNVNNELRLGFNHNYAVYSAGSFKYPGLDSYPNLVMGTAESAGVQMGPDPNAPQGGIQGFYQIADNISWVKGSHNFKFGGEYREYISPQYFTQRKRGDYEYAYYWSFFTDQVPEYLAERSVGNLTYYGNQNMFYAFAQDDWHIRKNFSINLGVRYEFTQVPLSERQLQPLNAIANAPGVITFASPAEQKKNFLPRLGFAWSPGSSGNTSVRGGFSMSQDVLYDNLGLLSLPPEAQQTCDGFAGGNSTSSSCYWNDPTNPASTTGFLTGGGLPFTQTIPPITDPVQARLVTSGYIPDQKLPYSEAWSLGIQHIFAQKYTAEVRYVGTKGIHLPVQQRLNRQAKTSATENLPMFFTNPGQAVADALTIGYKEINSNSSYVPAYANAGFTGANVVGFMPWGASKYNGMQAQLRRSFTNGLQLQAAWTWSHAMDNSTADVFSTYLTPRRAQDSNCFACDWSDSALDRRHRVTFQALYDLPFYKKANNWMMKNVIGNWEFGPVYTFQSPEKVTVQSGLDVNGNGDSAGDRVYINPAGVPGTGTGYTALYNDVVGGPLYGQIVGYYADSSTAYYVQAGKFSRPTARRNTLAMPHTNNFDMTLVKRLNFTESQSLEFQAQAFNLFNHPQYLPGNISDVGSSSYVGANILAILEPQQAGFNQPKSVFSNHPRGLTLVLKYNF